LDLQEGVHHAEKSLLFHGGRQIVIEGMELELTRGDSGEMSVYATAHIHAKVTGLVAERSDIQISLELRGEQYTITGATIFDVDIHTTGETTLQITGKLVHLIPKCL
jgi:hypothetical protein